MAIELQNTGLKVLHRGRLDRNQPVRFQLQRIEQLGQVPDFLEIIEWRLEQDQQIDITPCFGLAARLGAIQNETGKPVLNYFPIPERLFLKMTRLRTIIGHILKEGEGS